jgi:hypothetical protein
MRILRAALSYFALVFGAGFLLGLLRVPFLVPWLGVRTAELLEMPFMAVAILLAARLVRRRLLPQAGAAERAATGALALVLMLLAELAVGVLMLQRTPEEIVVGRDPVSGSVYLVLLLAYALLPLLPARGSTTTAVP